MAIGFGLDLGPLVRSGQLGAGLLVVVAAMLVAFGAALFFGRLLGIGPRASLLLGAGTADRAGASLAGPGDWNGDGFNDLFVGAPGAGSGAVYLVLGRELVEE